MAVDNVGVPSLRFWTLPSATAVIANHKNQIVDYTGWHVASDMLEGNFFFGLEAASKVLWTQDPELHIWSIRAEDERQPADIVFVNHAYEVTWLNWEDVSIDIPSSHIFS